MSTECPTCQREDFKNRRGMKMHHKMAHGESIAGEEYICHQCGETITKHKADVVGKTFCDHDCYGKFLEKLPEDLRYFHQSRQWEDKREEIKSRDNNECQWCQRVENLDVHHIRPLSQGGPPLDNSNLVTLCRRCHQWAHKGIKEPIKNYENAE